VKTKEEVQAEIATDLKRALSSLSGRPLSVQVSAHLDAAAKKIASLPTVVEGVTDPRRHRDDFDDEREGIDEVIGQCERALTDAARASEKNAALEYAIKVLRRIK